MDVSRLRLRPAVGAHRPGAARRAGRLAAAGSRPRGGRARSTGRFRDLPGPAARRATSWSSTAAACSRRASSAAARAGARRRSCSCATGDGALGGAGAARPPAAPGTPRHDRRRPHAVVEPEALAADGRRRVRLRMRRATRAPRSSGRARSPAALHPAARTRPGTASATRRSTPAKRAASPRPPRACTSRPALLERLARRGVRRTPRSCCTWGPGRSGPSRSKRSRTTASTPEPFEVPAETARRGRERRARAAGAWWPWARRPCARWRRARATRRRRRARARARPTS